TIRQLSSAPADRRAELLVALYDSLDVLIRPLAVDEMGMSGRPQCIPKLLELAANDLTPGFNRVKAIESLGRLRGTAATPLLIQIMEARQLWRWQYPEELRIPSAQALLRIDANTALDKLARCGMDRKDLVLEPADPDGNVTVIRQRRYARVK